MSACHSSGVGSQQNVKPEYNSIAPWVEVVWFHQLGFDSCIHTGSPSIHLEYKQDQPTFIACVLCIVVAILNFKYVRALLYRACFVFGGGHLEHSADELQ